MAHGIWRQAEEGKRQDRMPGVGGVQGGPNNLDWCRTQQMSTAWRNIPHMLPLVKKVRTVFLQGSDLTILWFGGCM